MNTEIDLDVILEKYERTYSKEHAKIKGSPDYNFKQATREAIHQALVLASEKATLSYRLPDGGGFTFVATKQSILDIIKLVK